MTPINIVLYLLLFLFSFQSAYSQNSLSLGVKGGFGLSIPSLAANQTVPVANTKLRGNVYYSFGVLGQYILGDRLGIETGVLSNYQGYSPMDQKGTVKSFLSIDSSVGVIDFQIPIQLIYKFNHPTNPYKHFKITSGVSLDWLEIEFLNYINQDEQPSRLFCPNLHIGFRVGNDLKKFGRFEYGLQYQYSLGGYHEFKIPNNNKTDIFNIRYRVLSFNFYYFFLNRDL